LFTSEKEAIWSNWLKKCGMYKKGLAADDLKLHGNDSSKAS